MVTLTTFTANTTAVASEVNTNFTNTVAAMDANTAAILLRGVVEIDEATVTAGTTVSISGISETYDLYLLTYSLSKDDGVNNGADRLKLQLNNDSSASYDYMEVEGTTNTAVANGTSFHIGKHATTVGDTLWGGAMWISVRNGVSRNPVVSGSTSNGADHAFFGGRLDSNVTQLTQVTISHERAFSGVVKIFGVSLT